MDSQSSTKSGIKGGFWDEKGEKIRQQRQQARELQVSGYFFQERERQEEAERKKKEERHQNALRNKIGHYIQNYLPIRLIKVSTMALVDRAMLQEQINQKITQGSFICDDDECICFEQVREELKYSILSHRWGSPELTFGEFGKLHEQVTQDGPLSLTATVSKMKKLWMQTPFRSSLDKLLHFQELSSQRHCTYAWVDTICINKESSAELDESIRSMYAWYRDSHICIVHLNQTHYYLDMNHDAWFTRGWTLQELLAPKYIKFFSSSWREITQRENDKDLSNVEQQAAKIGQDQPPLWSMISKITGIPIDDLLDFKPGLYDIGKRMSWASKRQTTRIEDMAYCLIGIFRVNLSIAYGEKEGAFYRLQVEIMQNSDDQSLFNWRGSASAYNGMFAASPECFSRALDFTIDNKPRIGADQTSASAANFERRISRIVHHKSEIPNLRIWKHSDATAFTILASSSEPEEHLLMLLKQIGAHHYERLDVTKMKFKYQLPKKNPDEIFIK